MRRIHSEAMGQELRYVLGVCGIYCSLAAGCGNTTLLIVDDWGHGGGGSGGAAQDGGTCPSLAECAPAPSESWWIKPIDYLLWLGPLDATPPSCPEEALTQAMPPYYEGLVAPEKCESCICQAPSGTCELPTELGAYYSHPAECPAPQGTPFEPFSAPNPWDGTCTKVSPIQGKAIQSLMIPPLIVKESPTCTPGIPPPRALIEPARWTRQAQICSTGDEVGHCIPTNGRCVPALNSKAREEGFVQCIGKPRQDVINAQTPEGDLETICPATWPHRHELYVGFFDTRTCSECTCGAPVGSRCSTLVSVDTTASDCTGTQITALVDSTKATCHDVPNGSALLSKRADKPVYEPGMCPPLGGEVISGGITENERGALVFCCR